MTGVFQGVFPLVGGEPLVGMDWACPGWESWGTCPPGLCSSSPVIPDVLSGEAASPTVVPEAPWLGLRLKSVWGVHVLPALLPCWGTNTACLGTNTIWEPVLPALLPGWILTLPTRD